MDAVGINFGHLLFQLGAFAVGLMLFTGGVYIALRVSRRSNKL